MPAEVVVPCMGAAELLESAGGRAQRMALVDGEARPTIRAAMSALARLDEDTFAEPDVLEASRAAPLRPERAPLMATTLQQLFAQIAAQTAEGAPRTNAVDVIGAPDHAGRALDRLAAVGLDYDADGPLEQVTKHLSSECRSAADAIPEEVGCAVNATSAGA